MDVHISERKRRGRIPLPFKRIYNCSECGYTSSRQFNVNRHNVRMHSARIEKLCCDIFYTKKSDFYRHIEDHHPNTRPTCTVSRLKYKIDSNNPSTIQSDNNINNHHNNSNIGNFNNNNNILQEIPMQRHIFKDININNQNRRTSRRNRNPFYSKYKDCTDENTNPRINHTNKNLYTNNITDNSTDNIFFNYDLFDAAAWECMTQLHRDFLSDIDFNHF